MGYPEHKQGNGNSGVEGEKRAAEQNQKKGEGRGHAREKEKRLCSGQCESVSPTDFRCHWSFQHHGLPVLPLNCHGSKWTFCAATITFRKELYCDLGVITAIELKRKGELGPWD